MKILVVSDTHHGVDTLREVVSKNQNGLDLVIHLGDNEDDGVIVMKDFPKIAFLSVLGNCDYHSFSYSSKYYGFFTAESRRLFYTHGHKYNVKYGTDMIVSNARLNGADIVLFGHTHIPFVEERNNGMLIVNPGSLMFPRSGDIGTYAILNITGRKVDCSIVEVN